MKSPLTKSLSMQTPYIKGDNMNDRIKNTFMKKTVKISAFFLLVLFQCFSGIAQNKAVNKADQLYQDFAFIDAIEIYKKVADKGYESADLFQKIGNSYFLNADYTEANKWYEKLFAIKDVQVDPEYYFRYAHTLKATGNQSLANEYTRKFIKLNALDNRAVVAANVDSYLAEIKNNSGRQNITDAGINSAYSDYGGSFYKDFFVFTSTRDTGGVSNVKHKWTNQSFSSLYAAKITSEGRLTDAEPFSKKINSKFNESSAVFTADGNTVFFTRNNYTNKKKRTDKNDNMLLKLYKSTFSDGKWSKAEELPFNSDEYSCAHPALSPDNKILYFASDMPGTLGMSDIFKVTINSDGSFGQPENLGSQINTEARETFPFVSSENELYFASDGHLGLGGLDVFATKILENNSFSKVFNVGTPVNSQFDDFAYIFDSNSKNGFFSSNREGGKGFDDIYKFTETKPLPLECKHEIAGIVVDTETSETVANGQVQLYDAELNLLEEQYTKADGSYEFKDLECDKEYIIRVVTKDFEPSESRIKTSNKSGKVTVSPSLDKKVKKVAVGTDLAKTFNIKIIYFDLDKYNIRKDAALDLQKIVEVMKANPTMHIDVRSHTDSRQTNDYNMKLSDRRAKATIAWMIKNGIDATRLTGKGYGESMLVNECADGVTCSEEKHQENRRSEFIITKM